MTEFICNSLKDTKNAAKYFSRFAKAGQCFALFGNLGYGKTTFSRYLIESLNKSVGAVLSPTFSLVQVYDSEVTEIWHIDCYRLKSADEFFELGIEEALQNCITIIEWPEIILHLLPASAIKIIFIWDGKTRKLIHESLCRK
ncbi:MAG: tRNA (adenosine(37)-N6)-threonylcarbamoyltransferase complex ATPase subunit type 1 TsaE [Holosporaceae bacterium]|jgi:tRNA threonylcarbamoyladenosine biosynthesis protein TsaE|nr:tRNA (adenosine(37)-N6)-threonylcarbamoyltransferase complex ATPase subunit type 1 TsaE [Holosporaceae bacterium]